MKSVDASALHRKAAGQPPRILIVRVGAMGDVLHGLPSVAMLRAALPGARIGWAVEPRWSPLLRAGTATDRDAERMPLVDAVHCVEAKQWNKHPASPATLRSILALRRELRAERYDIAIDLQGTLRSAVIARLSGAREVIGSATPREGVARRFYGTRVTLASAHVVDQAKELVRVAVARISQWDRAVLPAEPCNDTPQALLPRDPHAEAEWERRCGELCQGRKAVLLAATAGWGAKEWPPEKFAALAAALAERGYCVLLNAPPGQVDAPTARVLRTVAAEFPNRAAQVHLLPASLPLLIAATRGAEAAVAGDTGPLHLAEALGTATVGLFGPTNPARTGPRRNSLCLRDAESVTDHRRHPETEAGLARIPVNSVLRAFLALVEDAEAR